MQTGANAYSQNLSDAITTSDSGLTRALGRVVADATTLSESFVVMRLITFGEVIALSERFKKLLNGVSVVWGKATRSTASWSKSSRSTSDWSKVRKQ